jgi:hypothetical protein
MISKKASVSIRMAVGQPANLAEHKKESFNSEISVSWCVLQQTVNAP